MMISRQTLTSKVFDWLMDRIRTGELKAGDRLPTEKDMVNRLGVSRTCVREAIKSLEALRIVNVRPKLGAVLQEPTAAALFNAELFSAAVNSRRTDTLMEFRKILEVGLASLAAEKAEAGDALSIARSMAAYEEALEQGRQPYQADIDFHLAIASAAKNPLGHMVLTALARPLSQQLQLAEAVPGAAEEGLRDHQKIAGAIAERNPDKARGFMRAHMENAERYWCIANSGMASQEILESVANVTLENTR